MVGDQASLYKKGETRHAASGIISEIALGRIEGCGFMHDCQ